MSRFIVSASLILAGLAPTAADDKPTPKLPIGKNTTVVDGPLDKDGYIDYEAALNERLGKEITPEKNACVGLWAAVGPKPSKYGKGMPKEYFPTLGIPEPPADGAYFVELFHYLRTLDLDDDERTAVSIEQSPRATDRPWTAKEFSHLAAWLRTIDKPLDAVREAVKRPTYFHPLRSHRGDDPTSHLIGHEFSYSSACYQLSGALTTRAMLRLGEKQYDAAWQDMMACHRLGRHLSHGATMTEVLVGVAVDIRACLTTAAFLDRADPSAEQVRAYLAEWSKLPPPAPFAGVLDLGERFVLLDTIQLIRRGKGSFALFGEKPPGANDLKALDAIDWAPALRETNVWFDRLTAAAREPDRAKRVELFRKVEEDFHFSKKEKIELENLFEEMFAHLDNVKKKMEAAKTQPTDKAGKAIARVLIDMMGPAAGKMQESADRAEQHRRNLSVAFALHAFKKDTGKYPQKLADLAPKYLPSIPDDIFSSKPLIYKPTDGGYLLYSVGVNGKDDGGRSYGDDPKGDDLVVRMPLLKR